jgi:hypothetical protein
MSIRRTCAPGVVTRALTTAEWVVTPPDQAHWMPGGLGMRALQVIRIAAQEQMAASA